MTGAASVVGRPTGIDGGSFGFLAREGRAVAPAPHSVPGFIRHGWRITVANASFRLGFQYRAATIFFTLYSIPGVVFFFPYSIADSLSAT
jgi:hypothetical protein